MIHMELIEIAEQYLVNVRDGKVIFRNELDNLYLHRDKDVRLVPKQFVKSYDENGYIHDWSRERYDKWRSERSIQKSNSSVKDEIKEQSVFLQKDLDKKCAVKEEKAPEQKDSDMKKAVNPNNNLPVDSSNTISSNGKKKMETVVFDVPAYSKIQFQKDDDSSLHIKVLPETRVEKNNRLRKDNNSRISKDFIQFAKSLSYTPKHLATPRNRKNVEPVKNGTKKLRNLVITVLITSTVVSATVGIENGIDNYITNNRIHAAQTNIASLLSDKESESFSSILEKNTHVDDSEEKFIDTESIADELLLLPDQFFNASLFLIYDDLNDIDSEKFDEVINHVSHKANASTSPTAFATCHDCHSFREYLQKNGISSEADYVKFSRELINFQSNLIKKVAEEHQIPDVDPLLEDDSKLGGR